ncbi:ABC transporter substrate-binding protein [Rhizobium sp. RM]|uniref:LuxR C-terminal-related transcriptional regulator n=1 Tax=Rhizobium sp. RM TaxID=2748079 RepID=UPI00110DF398|nr:ABC transporter substrate-binding protein [Rhizobium sp. RM]NWJ25445.1 ABC transporter substrate-binding protein [Rhizobium sp. RM]TMV22077.1 ABC transporter substrate-binding protein [Rhizobium sp. Td3]
MNVSRETWRCLVDQHGTLEEFEDRTGALYIGAFNEVARYARALLALECDQIVFHIANPHNHWHRVQISRDTTVHGRDFAIVQMTLVKPPFNLTLRELDILTLVSIGLSNDNIAARLDIGKRTIEKHVENIFAKMQLWSRAALASHAVQRGICRLPTPGGCNRTGLGLSDVEDMAARLPDVKSEKAAPRRSAQNHIRPLIIGVPFASDGRGKADSVEMLNGAKLAVSEINERGGILGRTVELELAPFDSGDLTSTSSAYRDLIEKEVDAVTAGYACYSPDIHDTMGAVGIPYLHAATMHHAVERVRDSQSRLGNIFQTCASDVNYGLGLARMIQRLEKGKHWCTQKKRLAIVQPVWSNVDIGIDHLEADLAKRGWQTDIVNIIPGSQHAWKKAIDRLHQIDPAIIVVASFFVEDAIAFQRSFLSNPLRAIIYDIYAPSVPQFQEELGASSEGVIWATTSGLYADRIGEGFRQQYQRQFSCSPGSSQAGLAYDRIRLVTGAWSRAGHPRRFQQVLLELRSSIDRGVNGSYFLGNQGQVGLAYPDDTPDLSISQAHLVFQIQNGRNVIVGPAPFATGKMRTPPWWS